MENENIKEFRENFYNIYHKQVVPALKTLDKERLEIVKQIDNMTKKIYIIALIIIVICQIFTIILWNTLSVNSFTFCVIIFAIVIPLAIKQSKKKNFENSIKNRIMPILMSAFGNFSWTTDKTISDMEVSNSKLIERYEHYDTDDNFFGHYKNTNIRICESHLYYVTHSSKSRTVHTTFKGALVAIDSPKRFSGHTVLVSNTNKTRTGYPEVKLEDVEFDKLFNVTSTDQIEARYLLTPGFMQRFKNIQNAFGSGIISCSFRNNSLLLAIPVDKDMFALGDLSKPVADASQFNTFLNELISIFELIDELKLYDNTGL